MKSTGKFYSLSLTLHICLKTLQTDTRTTRSLRIWFPRNIREVPNISAPTREKKNQWLPFPAHGKILLYKLALPVPAEGISTQHVLGNSHEIYDIQEEMLWELNISPWEQSSQDGAKKQRELFITSSKLQETPQVTVAAKDRTSSVTVVLRCTQL